MGSFDRYSQGRFLRALVARHRLLPRSAAGAHLLRSLGLAAAGAPAPITLLPVELPPVAGIPASLPTDEAGEAPEPEPLPAAWPTPAQPSGKEPAAAASERTGALTAPVAPAGSPVTAPGAATGTQSAHRLTPTGLDGHARTDEPPAAPPLAPAPIMPERMMAPPQGQSLPADEQPGAEPARSEETPRAARSEQAAPSADPPALPAPAGSAAPPAPPAARPAPTPGTPAGAREQRRPGPAVAAQASPRPSSAELFAPRDDIDLSPAAWAARLGGGAPPASPAPLLAATAAAPQPVEAAQPPFDPAPATAAPPAARPQATRRDEAPARAIGALGQASPSPAAIAGPGALGARAVSPAGVEPRAASPESGGRYGSSPARSTPASGQLAQADALFAPGEQDRSPQAWAARLFPHLHSQGATSDPDVPVTPTAAPASASVPEGPHPAPLADPAPLAEPARALLRPLVGIDPAQARVHRGEAAAQVAQVHAADGLSVGDDILLGAGNADDSPATLGLIAHELTHLARRREPRFVPPVARRGPATPDDEEALARLVEAEVRQAAEANAPAPIAPAPAAQAPLAPSPTRSVVETVEPLSLVSPLPHGVEGAGVRDYARRNEAAHRSMPTSAVEPDRSPAPAPTTSEAPWGDLPAPWEPLPDWMGPGATPAPSAASLAAGPAFGGAASSEAAVQLAAEDRSLPAVEGPAPTPAPDPAPAAPPPDLDELAQQVYTRLRRRLAAERRREE